MSVAGVTQDRGPDAAGPIGAPDANAGGAAANIRAGSFLATVPASARDWRVAIIVVALSLVGFFCVLPFASVPLARSPAFIASYEAALTSNDLITAIVLFGKFARLRSPALLLLACGYLFAAFMIVAHALTFPGVYAPSGLLGAGSQSTAWLYVFWYGGFPLFVLAYAFFRGREQREGRHGFASATAITVAVAGIAALVCGLTALATAGMDLLPVLTVNGRFSPLTETGVTPTVWLLSLTALIAVWRRQQHMKLDVWLMVVLCAWLLDIALSALVSSARFDLGWYAGRSYGLLASTFVLGVVLLESAWLRDRLAAAQGELADRAQELERRVRGRTDELRRANETLTTEIAERRLAERELVSTRSFLDAIIESLPAMLLVKEATTGKVVYLNRAGEELTGIERAEIIGKTAVEVMQKGDASVVGLHDTKAMASDKPYETFEHSVHTRKRGERRLRVKKLTVPDEHGAPKYLLAFCEDVTEQRQTEEQLRHAQKMEAVGQLTGGLAHDFNNLLAIIIGNLDVLAELDRDPERHELVQAAIDAAVSGSDLTRRLLAFARRQPLQPAQVDLNDLLESISRLLRRTLGENIEIVLHLDGSIPPILVDRVQLETAIANLANNARDAMPKGGRLTIATRMTALDEDYANDHAEVAPGNYVVIEISDSGEGMSAEILGRIFEPFYTTKEAGKGTGLGLSMVFGFMKQSSGHINVYSEPGCGTTFRLYLPPTTAAAADIVVEAPPLQLAEPARETVLVVEDNPKLREIVVKQLSGLGFDVAEADNAERALDIIALRGGVDLLFTDVVLPGGMDGCALAREVMARSPRAKILLTSGFPGARLNDMQGVGTNMRLLSKPYRRDDLTRAVREVLAGGS